MKKVLVVDDNVDLAKLIESLLTQKGYRVAVAEGGLEGIQMADTFSPDLILMDLKMPDLTGDLTALRIKSGKMHRNTPIIALSAFGDPLTRSTTQDMAFADHITKPFELEELIRHIESALSHA